MRLRVALRMEYPSLERFFCDQIELAACPKDILLQELRVFCSNDFDDLPYRFYWDNRPLEHDYFINALRSARLQTLDLGPELEQLKTS